jgi:hypothetical protein
MQKCVTLSVTEAESVAAGLHVTLTMELETDNKGAKDLADGWTAKSIICVTSTAATYSASVTDNVTHFCI